MQNANHRESVAASANGYLMFFVGLGLVLVGAAAVVLSAGQGFGLLAAGVLALVCGVLVFIGLYMLQPNEAGILTLFGAYSGTDRNSGLRWANPLKAKRKLSLRARNLNVPALKVNDKRGNPVEIGAVVVWRVRDSAQAIFDVDNYELYVSLQAEAAVRHLASLYAYDDGDDLRPGETTLRAGQDDVAAALQAELGARFTQAGVEVLDAKLTHLAYAPEIAQVMLRRQQAEAVVSARQKIVHGAVTMVESALQGLSERSIVELDDERKAAMVSNLLVVLCSDRETQPVINTGTLYTETGATAMRIAVLLVWLADLAFLLLTLPLLPRQVGDPGKELPVLAYGLVMAATASLMPLVDRLLLPWLTRHAPQLVNMPHRDYWLAESRREATIDKLLDHMAWMELLMLLLLAGMHSFLVLQAKGHELPPALWTGAGGALVIAFFWQMVRMTRAFALPKP